MRSHPFLWEIGCEEIPADWLPGLLAQLQTQFTRRIEEARLGRPAVKVYGTLRRLVLQAPKLAEKQSDRREEITGPAARIARTESGEWSKAALGFARKNEIDPANLVVLETPKGDYVGFVRKVKGQPAFKLLPALMAASLRSLSFPKFMNWDAEIDDGRGAFSFGRPIRWMVCLLGRRVVPFQIKVNDGVVKAGNKSRGHRFLAPKGSRPGAPFAVSSFSELKRELKRRHVLLDPEERLARLEKQIQKLEQKAHAKRSSQLRGLSLRFLADLMEWPGAVAGSYPKEFSALPTDVRHTVLIHHQKYVPFEGKPSFIAVTNMPSDPKGFIRKGSELVVVARLRDANFFWDEDLKKSLASRRDALDGVLFHERLGSYRLKLDRFVPLSRWLAERCEVPVDAVEKAAELAKCDLTTGMVGEFPELQGVMGGLYAREQGEPDPVWKAVYSHYRPLGLGEDEDFPLNREAVLVSLADKLDTLAGMFAVGVVPTGSRDPFGLRRAALGVVRLLLEAESKLELRLDLTLRELVSRALAQVQEQLEGRADPKAEEALYEFLVERLRFAFSRNFRYDEINAGFALGAVDFAPLEMARRLEAVASLRGSADFEALSIAFKRIRNILGDRQAGEVDAGAFAEDAERDLLAAFLSIEPEVSGHLAQGRYGSALRALSRLRPQVDMFFDKVLVMAPEPRLRENRLALLNTLQRQFTRVADLSEIVAGPKPT